MANLALIGAIAAAVGWLLAWAVVRARHVDAPRAARRVALLAGIGALIVASVLDIQVIRSPGARLVDELYDASPRLRHWVEVQESIGKSRKEIHALVTDMARRGLRRLAAEQLEERAALFRLMLEQAPDVGACAEIVRGTAGDALQAAVLRLGDADRARLMRVSAASALAEIETTPAVVPFDRAAMNAAMKRVQTGLPDEDVRRLRAALAHLDKAADDDVCRAARTVYARALEMPEPTRGALLRGFIAY
jgi:hypothetical protein